MSSAERLFFTLSVPVVHAGDSQLEDTPDERLEFFSENYGAEITEDERWDLDAPSTTGASHVAGLAY